MTDPDTDLSGRLDASLRAIAAVARAPAVVLAAVVGGDTAVACHGAPVPDAHTVFELGSITKTFTALLLAEMVTRGEVDYDDPITARLPTARGPTAPRHRRADHPGAVGHPHRGASPPAGQPLPAGTTDLVWNHRSSRHGDVLFHSGATRGFTAFVGFCPQAATGVAALVNTTPTHRRNMIPAAYSLFKTLIREHRSAAV